MTLSISVVMSIIGFFKFKSEKIDDLEVVYLKRGDIEDYIQERGVFRVYNDQTIVANVSGQVDLIDVEIGDVVSKNKSIGLIHSLDINHQIQALKYQLKNDHIEMKYLIKQLVNYRSLANQNAIALQEYQQIILRKNQLKTKIDSKIKKRRYLKQKKKMHEIKSDISGVVVEKYVKSGEMVRPGVPVIKVLQPDLLRFEVIVRDYDAHKIKVGQMVRLSSSAFGQHTIKGAVEKIIPLISNHSNGLGLKVLISIHDDIRAFNIYGGHQATAEISVSTARNVLFLPIEFVHKDNEGHYVFLDIDKDYQKTYVTIGERNQNKIEILSGLNRRQGVVRGTIH